MARGPVNLPPNFNPNDSKYKKFANRLPTRELCDESEPSEMFLWMLVALPGVNGGHQVMPSSYNMLVSEHLYECGAMLKCPECGYEKPVEKVYVAPQSNDAHWLTSPGRWVRPEDAPKREENPIDKAIDGLTNQQQAALFERLKKRHEQGRI